VSIEKAHAVPAQSLISRSPKPFLPAGFESLLRPRKQSEESGKLRSDADQLPAISRPCQLLTSLEALSIARAAKAMGVSHTTAHRLGAQGTAQPQGELPEGPWHCNPHLRVRPAPGRVAAQVGPKLSLRITLHSWFVADLNPSGRFI